MARAVRSKIIEVLATRILTYEELVNARDSINASLSGSAAPLHERRQFLESEQRRLQLAISNLIASLEKSGPVGEIEERLSARRKELTDANVELEEIESRILGGAIRVGDDVLLLLADEMQAELDRAEVRNVRAIIHQTIQQATLFLERLQIHYSR